MEVDQFVRSNLDEFEAKLAKNDLALDVIVGTGSSLSILGSASIIITTLIFHKLQKHCFSLRLILYVQTSTPTFTHALMVNRFISLCDLIISASFISGIVSKQSGWWSQQSKKDSVCVIQVRVIFRAVFAFSHSQTGCHPSIFCSGLLFMDGLFCAFTLAIGQKNRL